MFKFSAAAYFSDKTVEETTVNISKINNAKIAFLNAEAKDSSKYFDAECAVKISISPTMEIEEYLSDSRYSSWWRKPFFGSELSKFPQESQFAVFKMINGEYVAIFPLVGKEYKSVLSNDTGCFCVKVYSGYAKSSTCSCPAFIYEVGREPYSLIENCIKTALDILNNGTKHISERKYPEIFEYLGWCTWDSMQIRVCEEGVIEKCREFKEKNVPIKWAILDDMWAEVKNFYGKEYSDFRSMLKIMKSSSLDSFSADPVRFPNGLEGCISKVKEFGLKVGVWYPTIGYWCGISKDGEAYKALKDYLIQNNDGWNVPDWKTERAYPYYKTINEFLKSAGAEFIKVDRQSNCELDYAGLAPIGTVAGEYHMSLERSAKETFNGVMINCMGMASEDMYSRSDSPVSRCSDDFQPENREWFSKHILQCAYNSVMQGQLYWCDWDMWWTDDNQAVKNSVLRAVSGGPVYVSDKIGRTKAEILKPLALSDGRILRCDRCAVPTADCLTKDPTTSGEAIKLQNMAGACGVLAVMNIDRENRPVTAKICGSMINGFCAEEYGVYEHFSKTLTVLKGMEEFETMLLDNDDFRLYIFVPLTDGNGIIGRTDKFISPKTIKYNGGASCLIEAGPYAYIDNRKLCFKG